MRSDFTSLFFLSSILLPLFSSNSRDFAQPHSWPLEERVRGGGGGACILVTD